MNHAIRCRFLVLLACCLSMMLGCAVPIKTTITSEPSGADIYWGPSKYELAPTGYKTPHVETLNPENKLLLGYWRDWFYQVKKDGYKDSEIIFKKESTKDRNVHIKLGEALTTTISSEPSGAEIYSGPSEDNLVSTGNKTPHTETHASEEDVFYQVKKAGYNNSEVILKKKSSNDRDVHFNLTEYIQLSVTATGSVGTLERITVGGAEEDYPRLSPDGKWLLIGAKGVGPKAGRNYVLQKIDLKSGPRVILTPENSNARDGDWLPDGSSFVYSSNRANTFAIVQSFGTEGESGIKFISPLSFGNAFYPDVSPDGKQVTFTILSNDTTQICTIDIDGKNLKIFGEGQQSQWSPDGNTLLFQRKIGDVQHIYQIDADSGKNLIELTSGISIDHTPTWSPDGKHIAFISLRSPRHYHLYVMDTKGRNITQLTDGDFDVLSASWGSDGFIYFSANAGSNKDIWRLKPKI